MGWLETFRRHRAARQFARKLPGLLASCFWAAKFYTPGQVRSALEQGKLGGRHVAIAYAGCVTEDDYTAAAASYPVPMAYAEARALFQRYRRSGGPTSAFHPAEEYTGGGGGHLPD